MAIQTDLLGFIANILSDRRARAAEANQASQFDRSLAQRGREFDLSRSDELARFEAQQALARDQFAEETRRFGIQSGLSQAEQAERIRQFDANLATERDQFAQELGLNRERVAQSADQFNRNLGEQTRQFDLGFQNTQQQQQLDALQRLAQLSAQPATNTAQADVLSMLSRNSGVPIASQSFLGVSPPRVGLPASRGYSGAYRNDAISGMIPANDWLYNIYLNQNPANTGTIRQRRVM